MDLFDFTYNLSKHQQYELLKQKGVKLAETNDGQNRYFLYQVDSFYVEAKFHIELSAIQDAKGYSLENIPEIYLNKIDIPGF